MTLLTFSLAFPLATANAMPTIRADLEINRHAGKSLVIPVAVFGKDNRKFLSRKKEPITKKVGLLYNRRSRTLCTAFCIDKSIIATASHCLFGKAGRRRQKLRDFTFSLDHKRRGNRSFIEGARLNAASQHVIAGSTRLRVRPPIDATKDWALVRLQRPVCKNGGLKVSELDVAKVIKKSKSKKFYQVAFHRDLKKWQLAHSRSCTINRRFGKFRWSTISKDFTRSNLLILHRCDTGGASSGSPLMLETDEGPVVVGVNVGTYIQSKILMRNGRIAKRFKPQTVANTGVSANAFKDLIKELKEARIITDPEQMRVLQTELKKRLIYAGPIDGTYGRLTRTAISHYQKKMKWPRTGLPTATLLEHFQGELLATSTPTHKQTAGSTDRK